MRLSTLLSGLVFGCSVSLAYAQQAATSSTTTSEGITRETITTFSAEKGIFVPLQIEMYGKLRAETLGSSTQEHCVGQAGLKANDYRKKGAIIEEIEKSERTAFYVATLGATKTLRERVILIYCDGFGNLTVGLKVDPALAGQMTPVAQTVKETSGNSKTNSSGDAQPPVTININNGQAGN